MRETRNRSLAVVAFVYVLAIGAGALWLWAGPATGSSLWDALIADVLATLVIFTASRVRGNSSFYDAWWSVAPPLLVGYWWALRGEAVDGWRALLLAVVVGLWAIRLTGNWVATWPGLHHEDWRYGLLKERAPRLELLTDLVAIHLIPTMQVFLGLVPAWWALTRGARPFGVVDLVALAVGLGAVCLSWAADRQLHAFTRSRRPGEMLATGLWSWSRHPNYFGELLFWVSIALFGVASAPGEWWWLFAGVAAMLAMFLGASIPMMEQRSLERRPGYQAVIDRVSTFVPRPPR